jgi:hypothetical protein
MGAIFERRSANSAGALVSSESLLFTGWPEKSLGKCQNRILDVPREVNPQCTNLRLLIAFHSPYAFLETGLRMCLPEKSQGNTAFHAERSVLCNPVCQGTIAKYEHYSRISALRERNFSAVKTAWRSECDSNSRYRFEFRNPRRLRNLQAEQHLTRESTGSDWPLGR